MSFVPPFQAISWSDVFHASHKIGIEFITSVKWFEPGKIGEIVKNVGGVSLMARQMLVSWLQSWKWMEMDLPLLYRHWDQEWIQRCLECDVEHRTSHKLYR